MFLGFVGGIRPVTFFIAVNTPEFGAEDSGMWHGFTLSFHSALIAYAGVLANLKMLRLMVAASGDFSKALRTFFAWTAGNLFLGAQIAYTMRPFFGTPTLPVAFLREDAWDGNFYVSQYNSLERAVGGNVVMVWLLIVGAIFVGLVFLNEVLKHEYKSWKSLYAGSLK